MNYSVHVTWSCFLSDRFWPLAWRRRSVLKSLRQPRPEHQSSGQCHTFLEPCACYTEISPSTNHPMRDLPTGKNIRSSPLLAKYRILFTSCAKGKDSKPVRTTIKYTLFLMSRRQSFGAIMRSLHSMSKRRRCLTVRNAALKWRSSMPRWSDPCGSHKGLLQATCQRNFLRPARCSGSSNTLVLSVCGTPQY